MFILTSAFVPFSANAESSVVVKNAALIYQALFEVTNGNPENLALDSATLSLAKILDSLDAKEIADIQIQLDDWWLSRFCVTVTDKDGNNYFIHLDRDGGAVIIWAGTNDKGEVLWFDNWHNTPPTVPRWYNRLPSWLRWILWYIFFGWIWMK